MESTKQKVRLLPNTGNPNRTIFVLGATGSGKTTLIANLLLEYERFVIFDTKNDYTPEFFPNSVIVDSYRVFIDCLNSGKPRIIYDVSQIQDMEEQEEQLNEICIACYNFQLTNKQNKELPPLCFALDELNQFITGQTTCDGLQLIINKGRGVNIQKIFGAQWFGTIPTWIRNSFTEVYAFAHFDGAGLSRLAEYGFNSEEITSLQDYTCIHNKKNNFRQIILEAVAS